MARLSVHRPFVIGLTGGIACGKSTISAYLREKGIPVIDGDIVARQIVEPGSDCLAQIVAIFGEAHLHEDGTLNRPSLGKTVFSDPNQLQALNTIMKPFLLDAFQRQIAALQRFAIVVLDAALLLEDEDFFHLADEIWLVTTTVYQQKERLMNRNSYTAEEAQQRIDAQMCDADRRKLADVVIDNQGTIADTIAQVERYLPDL